MAKRLLSISYLQLHRDQQYGYIALLSVIVMGALLIAVTTGFAVRAAENRLNELGHELKAQNRASTIACAAKALLNYALDQSYIGDETITVNDSPCSIQTFSVTNNSTLTIITTVGQSDMVTTVQTIIKIPELLLISQHEIIK